MGLEAFTQPQKHKLGRSDNLRLRPVGIPKQTNVRYWRKADIGPPETKSGILFQMGVAMGWKAVLALSVALALSGCMSSGTQVSDTQIDQFVKGKTTEAEVIAALGPPDMRDRSSNGERSITYMYTKIAAGAQSFIPIVGGLIATTDTKTKMVRFSFSQAGVLKEWTTTGSGSTINNGLLNQN